MARNKRKGRSKTRTPKAKRRRRSRALRATRPRCPRIDMAQLFASEQAAQLGEERDPSDLLLRELQSSSGRLGDDRQAMTIRLAGDGFTTTATPLSGDPVTLERYFADHQMLPLDVDRWSVERLESVVRRAVDLEKSEKAWRRALMLLAHHTSEHAVTRLLQLKSSVPGSLHDYWQLAYDESLEWLDHDHEMRRTPDLGLGQGLQAIESGETSLN